MEPGNKRVWRWTISGRVQGVAFRWHTCRAARDLGLVGWVRNRADGTVEVQVAGDEVAVGTLREILRRGPYPVARVDRLNETLLDVEEHGWRSFDIQRDN